MISDPEGVRPAWTFNNPSAFLYWMKTGASELPAGWVEDSLAETNALDAADHHFQRSLATDDQGRDEIDRGLDDDRVEVPWPKINPPSRRKDSEVTRLLDLLDNLPTGKELA